MIGKVEIDEEKKDIFLHFSVRRTLRFYQNIYIKCRKHRVWKEEGKVQYITKKKTK